jgi:hypothetical protein
MCKHMEFHESDLNQKWEKKYFRTSTYSLNLFNIDLILQNLSIYTARMRLSVANWKLLEIMEK